MLRIIFSPRLSMQPLLRLPIVFKSPLQQGQEICSKLLIKNTLARVFYQLIF